MIVHDFTIAVSVLFWLIRGIVSNSVCLRIYEFPTQPPNTDWVKSIIRLRTWNQQRVHRPICPNNAAFVLKIGYPKTSNISFDWSWFSLLTLLFRGIPHWPSHIRTWWNISTWISLFSTLWTREEWPSEMLGSIEAGGNVVKKKLPGGPGVSSSSNCERFQVWFYPLAIWFPAFVVAVGHVAISISVSLHGIYAAGVLSYCMLLIWTFSLCVLNCVICVCFSWMLICL